MDFTHKVLAEEGIPVYVVEPSLTSGNVEAWDSTVEALKTAAIGPTNCVLVFKCL